MTLPNFQQAKPVDPTAHPVPRLSGNGNSELRSMALGIQAWLDGSAELVVASVEPPVRQCKPKPSRKK